MSLRSCGVTVTDLQGVKHTVDVTASTLYEAVELGLLAIRDQEWAADIAEGVNTVDVVVNTVPVTHSVRMPDFKRWLNRTGGTPKEITQRDHIRCVLGHVK